MDTRLALYGSSPIVVPFAAQEIEPLSSEPSPADEAYNARLSRIVQDPFQQMATPPQLLPRVRRFALPDSNSPGFAVRNNDSPEALFLPPPILSNIPEQDVNGPRPPEAAPPYRAPTHNRPLQLLPSTTDNSAEHGLCSPHAPDGQPRGGRNKTKTRVKLQTSGPDGEQDVYIVQPRRHVRYRSLSEPLPLLQQDLGDGGEPLRHIPHPPKEPRHEGSPVQNRSPRVAAGGSPVQNRSPRVAASGSPRGGQSPRNMPQIGFDFRGCKSMEDFLAQLQEDPHAKSTFMKECAREYTTENSGFIIDWLEKTPEEAKSFEFLKHMYLKYISQTSSAERGEAATYLNLDVALAKTIEAAYRNSEAADQLRKIDPSANHEEAGSIANQALLEVVDKAFSTIADMQFRNLKTRAPYQGA